jgi:hypothetical protein
MAMLIRRCAWHRSYRGYPIAFGVASWRGLRPSFTDGMCLGCSAKLRREWNLPPLPAATDRYGLRGELVRVAAMAVMAVSLLLAARPLDELRMIRAIVQPPQTVLVPPAPVEEESVPSLAVAEVARRVATPSLRVATPSLSRPLGASYLGVTIAQTAMAPLPEQVRSRFPAEMTLAALPHAGLMQQTP